MSFYDILSADEVFKKLLRKSYLFYAHKIWCFISRRSTMKKLKLSYSDKARELFEIRTAREIVDLAKTDFLDIATITADSAYPLHDF